MTILRPNPLDTVAPIPERGHGGDPGPRAGGRVRQDPVLPVRDPDRPQPRQPVRGVPPHPGRHHGGDTQAGQLTTSALHSSGAVSTKTSRIQSICLKCESYFHYCWDYANLEGIKS